VMALRFSGRFSRTSHTPLARDTITWSFMSAACPARRTHATSGIKSARRAKGDPFHSPLLSIL
jgi:hypothetical protein